MTSKGETWSRGTNSRLPFDVNLMLHLSIGPLQLALTWYKTATQESLSHTGTGHSQKAYIILNGNFFVCLVSVRILLSSTYGGFVPREWLAAKDLLICFAVGLIAAGTTGVIKKMVLVYGT